MAKRLGDLAPRLIPRVEKAETKNPLIEEEDYAAIAELLRERRERAGSQNARARQSG